MFFQACFTETCQSNELSVLAQRENKITSTVLFLRQYKNGLDDQLNKFLGARTNNGLYHSLLLDCSRGEYGLCGHLLGAAMDQVPSTNQE